MTRRDERTIPAEVIEQASAWMFRIKGAPDDATVREDLDAWLGADETHSRAWALAERTWTLTGQAQPSHTTEWAERNATTHRPSHRRRNNSPTTASPARSRQIRRAAIPAMAAALLLSLMTPSLLTGLRADYSTATGVNQAVHLEDDSRLVMGADTAITRNFTGNARQVEMLRGEAWFDVAHNSHRPFIVSAGDMRVTVTGTAFDVGMTEQTLSVALARGSVRVDLPGTASVTHNLRPGEWLDIDRATGAASLKTVPVETIGTWRRGRIAVQDANLADVVEVIGRHHRGRIFISGDNLANRKVTGVYDLNDPVRGLKALIEPYGGQVKQVTPWVLILSES